MTEPRIIQDILRRLDHLESLSQNAWDFDTYTPTYLGATTPGATTYTTQDGFWWQDGPRLFFTGRLIWTAATGTGSATISLPFASRNTTGLRYTIRVFVTNVTFANGSVQATIGPGASIFTMASPATNAASTTLTIEAAGDIIFTGEYIIDP